MLSKKQNYSMKKMDTGRKTVFHKIKGKIEENYENVNRTREGVGDLRNLQDLTKTSLVSVQKLGGVTISTSIPMPLFKD